VVLWVTHVSVAGVRTESRCLVLAWFECRRMPLNVVGGVRGGWSWRRAARGGAAAAVKVWRLTSVGAQAGA
jgi:hypothetical protein